MGCLNVHMLVLHEKCLPSGHSTIDAIFFLFFRPRCTARKRSRACNASSRLSTIFLFLLYLYTTIGCIYLYIFTSRRQAFLISRPKPNDERTTLAPVSCLSLAALTLSFTPSPCSPSYWINLSSLSFSFSLFSLFSLASFLGQRVSATKLNYILSAADLSLLFEFKSSTLRLTGWTR